jgi:uncharacterized protein (UPF0276 family)
VVAAVDVGVAAVAERVDRVGLLWSSAIAPGLLGHLERVDVIEIIAEQFMTAPTSQLRALRSLGRTIPLRVHGVGLGVASASPVEQDRVDRLARLVDQVEPELWSEHLAFVRSRGVEIGHLAAPPRNATTVEGAVRNLRSAQQVVGAAPLVENIATLLDPPASDRDEATWVGEIAAGAEVGLLLDLHNLHANATNFGFSATEYLDRIPMERVSEVHVSGGETSSLGLDVPPRLVDDHRHDPPPAVFDLLEDLAARGPGPLTVVIERDGQFPPMSALLAQVGEARAAIARGRARRSERVT